MQVDADQLRMLAQIGFIAAARARVADAEAIFAAIAIERPTRAAAYMGLAIAYLTSGRSQDALAALDRGLAVQGQSETAELHALRGVTLQLSGRASESLQALRAAGDHPIAKAMLGSGR